MKVIIWGCGQGGRTVRNLLPSGACLLAFTDSNQSLHGLSLEGVPIIPPEQLPSYSPDLVWIAVRNREAAASIQLRLRELAFSGTVQCLSDLCDTADLRIACLRMLAAEIRRREIPGELAELGVYRGDFAAEMNRLLPERRIYLFDTFHGFPPEDAAIENARNPQHRNRMNFEDTSESLVRSRLPRPEQAVFCKGRFPESLQSLPEPLPTMALVSLDPDLYEPTRQGLKIFWPLLAPGGIILIHDYNNSQFPGAGEAVREFCRENRLSILPLPDLHGSAALIKQTERSLEKC